MTETEQAELARLREKEEQRRIQRRGYARDFRRKKQGEGYVMVSGYVPERKADEVREYMRKLCREYSTVMDNQEDK